MVQQQASGRLQRLYVRGEIVLYAHKIVHVQVYCVCLVIHTYTTRHRLIYFNKLNFLLQVICRNVCMILVVKCVTVTCFFIAHAAL